MEEKKLVPKIRFNNYNEKWTKSKISEIGEIIAGGDVEQEKIRKIGKYPIIANTLNNDGIIGYYNHYYRIEAPAVTVTGRGNIGIAKARYENFIPVVRLLVIKSNFDVYFLEQVINKHKVIVESTGVPQLTAPQLGRINVKYPKFTEQQKIGEFFKVLDERIANQERKIAKVKALKEAYLTEMFPQKGETVPKRRFKGFEDEWEKKKLGTVIIWTRGNKLSKNVLNTKGIGNKVVHYADLYKFNPVVENVIHWSNSSEGVIIPQNSLLFPMSDVTPQGLARTSTILETNVRASGDTLIGELKGEINAEFMSYQINANSRQILPYVTGTTVRHISAESLDNLNIFVPGYSEQKKISSFLNKIEKLIKLENSKLEKLKKTKEAYLEEMFV